MKRIETKKNKQKGKQGKKTEVNEFGMYPIYRTLETFIQFSFMDTVVIMFRKKREVTTVI